MGVKILSSIIAILLCLCTVSFITSYIDLEVDNAALLRIVYGQRQTIEDLEQKVLSRDRQIAQYDIDTLRRPTLEEFTSVGELRAFIESDSTDRMPPIPNEWDCDDYARRLRDNAAAIGKELEVTIHPIRTKHVVNMAFIGNEVWLVEPQNDYMWQYAVVDKR